MLGNKNKLTDEEIIGMLMDTVIATSDTFIAMTEWMVGLAALHPKILRKLQAEIDEVAPDRLIEPRDQQQCVYFNAFMKEIFRMYPITPINPPRRAMVDSQLGGYDVPKDTWVFQHWGSMGMREDLWEKPEQFRPERFLEEAKAHGDEAMKAAALKQPNNLSIFAFGKRSCPGYRLGRVSAFMQGAMFFQLFDWEITADSDMSRHNRLITFPKKLKVRIKYRHRLPLETLLAKPANCSGAWLH